MYRIIVKRVASLFGLPGFSGRSEQLKRARESRRRGQFSLRALLIATMIAGVLGGQAGDCYRAYKSYQERAYCKHIYPNWELTYPDIPYSCDSIKEPTNPRDRILIEMEAVLEQRQKEIGGGWMLAGEDELLNQLDWSSAEPGDWENMPGTECSVPGDED